MAIFGRDLGTYYYRAKATNVFGESGWSNVQSTTVTKPKPPCPQAGAWYTCSMGSYFTVTTTFMSTQSIVNPQFTTGGSTPKISGTFNSPTQASGTWSYSGTNPLNPIESCYSSGTWSATP